MMACYFLDQNDPLVQFCFDETIYFLIYLLYAALPFSPSSLVSPKNRSPQLFSSISKALSLELDCNSMLSSKLPYEASNSVEFTMLLSSKSFTMLLSSLKTISKASAVCLCHNASFSFLELISEFY